MTFGNASWNSFWICLPEARVRITSTPHGDGNTKKAILIKTGSCTCPNYLYPSRGRKLPCHSSCGDTLLCPNYLYPSRGRKLNSLSIAYVIHLVRITSTPHGDGNSRSKRVFIEAFNSPNYLYPSRGRKPPSRALR